MNWNFSMADAPRDGRQILVATRTPKDSKKLFLTSWLEPTKHTPAGRFDGFSENSEALLAWCEVPMHPHHMMPADHCTRFDNVEIPIIDGVGSV